MADTVTFSSDLLWIAAAIFGLLLLSAFFSGSETALTAASRAKLHGLAEKGHKAAERALGLTEDSERLIGAILLGNNLANILAASLATSLFTALLGEGGVAMATLVMTLLVLVFAEVLPKTYAITNAESAATKVSLPIAILVKTLAPAVSVVRAVVNLTLRLFGVKADPNAKVLAHEEIAEAISLHHSEGGVEKSDRDRLLAALDLKHRTVEEVMMHRSGIEMINADDDPEDIVTACLRSPYTRIPVYREETENIVGVVHAKTLLRAVDQLVRGQEGGVANLRDLDVMNVVMEPWFVPNTTTLDDQMHEFLRRNSHFALVVDEYGALQGLITLEDILEEIVGDIADEHDIEEDELKREADGSVILDGGTTVRDVNRLMDWNLPDDEAYTIAGLVIHGAQAIPTPGQAFSFYGFRFEVIERERNRLTRVRARKLD